MVKESGWRADDPTESHKFSETGTPNRQKTRS
jgi:hypothetical protein